MSAPRRRPFAAAAALALLAFAALPGCSDDTTPGPIAPAADDGKYGSFVDETDFNVAAQALPVEALRDPPGPIPLASSHRLSNLPAVSQQGTAASPGSPGTCEAQSFGYGLGSYTAARNVDGSVKWDASQPGNEMSVAYQFAQSVKEGSATCPAGGQALPYLSRLVGYGSPTTTDVPYQPSCAYFASIDLGKSYPDAKRLRIGSFATFKMTQPNAIALIKGYVMNGQAVAFSGGVFKEYAKAPVLTEGVFYDVAANIIPDSGHGQLVVGFDDTVGATGKKGALLVQNSFGTDWPPKSSNSIAPAGMLYWAYDTFAVSQKLMAVAYPYDGSTPTGTMLGGTPSSAPVAAIKRAFQWSSGNDDTTYLIFMHHLADAVRITSVAVQEPSPGTALAGGTYGQFISNGYTYFKRTDGKQFLPGTYQVKMQATAIDGTALTYTASVTVGASAPSKPAAASMKDAAGKLFDSIGKAATLSTAP